MGAYWSLCLLMPWCRSTRPSVLQVLTKRSLSIGPVSYRNIVVIRSTIRRYYFIMKKYPVKGWRFWICFPRADDIIANKITWNIRTFSVFTFQVLKLEYSRWIMGLIQYKNVILPVYEIPLWRQDALMISYTAKMTFIYWIRAQWLAIGCWCPGILFHRDFSHHYIDNGGNGSCLHVYIH